MEGLRIILSEKEQIYEERDRGGRGRQGGGNLEKEREKSVSGVFCSSVS